MSESIYYYRYHDLVLRSTIILGELIEISAITHDITIDYGDVPDSLPGANVIVEENIQVEIIKNRFLFKPPHAASYLITNGERIIVSNKEKWDQSPIVEFQIIGRCLQICCFQRGLFTMHASAVVMKDGAAAAFAGPSGMGKSSIATTLAIRGYPLLSDDTILLKYTNDKGIFIPPSNRNVKLWEDVVQKLDSSKLKERKALDIISEQPEKTKYSINVNESFYDRAVPLSKIYCLAQYKKPKPHFTLKETNGYQKLMLIKKYCLRNGDIIGDMGLLKELFEQILFIEKNIPIKIIKRPTSESILLNEMADFVESDFYSK